jgi:DNA primase
MIKQEKIVEVRDRASIVEIISDYVTLKKSGRNYMGLCPFHAEKTPSFTVSDEKGIYHCFGCQTGGSVFHFLMQYDHLTFPEAVERVAKRYGLEIERADRPGAPNHGGEREHLYRINEHAAENYHKLLWSHPEGKQALRYLKSRGLDEAAIRQFMLGYAPHSGSGLLDLLAKEKLPIKDALRLGLLGQRTPQEFHEKFFSRVIFPIGNAAGKIVGFGGRVLNQGLPKYLNSSETPLFHKGSTLYGLYQARDGIRKNDRVVVVEGYLDVIALSQAGLPCVVATLGTALTVNHVRALARYTQNVIALFDGDEAGRKAAARSFEVFVEAGLLGRAAFLPAGEDPDTFVRSRGKAAVEEILARAVPLADYYFSWLELRHGSSLQGKSQTAQEISRVLAKLTNAFEVDLLIRRAVDTLGIREELLRRPAVRPQSPNPAGASAAALPSAPADRTDRAERALLALMLRFPSVARAAHKETELRQWIAPQWRSMVDVILAEWQEREGVDLFRVSQKLPAELSGEISALALEGERVSDSDSDKVAADCLAYLRRRHLRGLERSLRIAIRAAEESKDEKAKRERILEWQEIVRKKRQLDRRLEPKTTIR